MVINRSILNNAIIALTGPLPVHKSKSVIRAEQRAEFLAKRKAERCGSIDTTQDDFDLACGDRPGPDEEMQERAERDIKYGGTPQDHSAQIALYQSIVPFAHGHEDSHMWESENNKPKSARTYYLYFNGRVSQRLMHAEDLHATCRAHDTAEALDKFTQSYRAHGCQPLDCPHIGR